MSGYPEHTNLRRPVTRAVRADHHAHWQRIAEETERVAAIGDTQKLYHLVKQSSRSSAPFNEPLLDRSGEVITNLEKQLARWEEHILELLNHVLHLQAPIHRLQTFLPLPTSATVVHQRLMKSSLSSDDWRTRSLRVKMPSLMRTSSSALMSWPHGCIVSS